LKILFTFLISFFFFYASGQIQEEKLSIQNNYGSNWVKVMRPITIKDYFVFMDSIVHSNDSLVNYELTEHILVRANPWIIDSLANTDYYRLIQRDSFVYDQTKMIILRTSDSLKIPDSLEANLLLKDFNNTRIEVNTPEFKLRIFQDSIEIYSFPIRVGQHKKKYLKMGNRITDLRTKTGVGKIIRHEKNPKFYNPVNGKQFYLTKRDDEKTTVMPQIPWIETEINGVRNGQMIHPTTNPKSLGEASSNGCIGMKEADSWIIYYYAPLNTIVEIRYDLNVRNEYGIEKELKDIYDYTN